MSGYVFYCSRCKIDHAGECPPTVSITVAAPRVYLADSSPPVNRAPAVGSRWRLEIQMVSSTTWNPAHWEYVVTGVDSGTREVIYDAVQTSSPSLVLIARRRSLAEWYSGWTPTGHTQGLTNYARLVPQP